MTLVFFMVYLYFHPTHFNSVVGEALSTTKSSRSIETKKFGGHKDVAQQKG